MIASEGSPNVQVQIRVRGGLFGGDRQQDDGGKTNLNRSFSGTY